VTIEESTVVTIEESTGVTIERISSGGPWEAGIGYCRAVVAGSTVYHLVEVEAYVTRISTQPVRHKVDHEVVLVTIG
jgi:hypothetical protein